MTGIFPLDFPQWNVLYRVANKFSDTLNELFKVNCLISIFFVEIFIWYFHKKHLRSKSSPQTAHSKCLKTYWLPCTVLVRSFWIRIVINNEPVQERAEYAALADLIACCVKPAGQVFRSLQVCGTSRTVPLSRNCKKKKFWMFYVK